MLSRIFKYNLIIPMLLVFLLFNGGCNSEKIVFPFNEPNILFCDWGDSAGSGKLKMLNVSSGSIIELQEKSLLKHGRLRLSNSGKWIWSLGEFRGRHLQIYDIENSKFLNSHINLHDLNMEMANLGTIYEFGLVDDTLIYYLEDQIIKTYSLKSELVVNSWNINAYPYLYTPSSISSDGIVAISCSSTIDDEIKESFDQIVLYNCRTNNFLKIPIKDHVVLNWSPNGKLLLLTEKVGASVMEYPSLRISKLQLTLPAAIENYVPYFFSDSTLILASNDLITGYQNFYLYDLTKRQIVKQLTSTKSHKIVMDIYNRDSL